MKKINSGIKLEFTLEEVQALKIALPLLSEISTILNENDGIIFDKENEVAILDCDDVSGIDLLEQALLNETAVTITPGD